MRGISEKELEKRLQALKHDSTVRSLLEILIDDCRELKEPWIPIDENTPRDRRIKIYDAGYEGQVIVQWNEYFRCFIDPRGHKYLNPTHYQELPEDPIIPINTNKD